VDLQIQTLNGNLSAKSAEEPLTLRYEGDEPYYRSVKGWPRTLLVQLHAWSGTKDECLSTPTLGQVNNCVWVCPNFGGQNNHPEGAAHPNQLERIKRVIDATKDQFPMVERVILFGQSGGGYTSLMFMAAYPGVAYGASLWVFPFDLADWHAQKAQFRPSLEACLGGPPDTPARIAEYNSRSPMSVNLSGRVLHLNGSDEDVQVPFSHQTRARDRFAGTNTVTFRNFAGGHITQWGVAVAQIQSMQPT
jgi:pimeloyl-ACP methyl ester carboxylesterase